MKLVMIKGTTCSFEIDLTDENGAPYALKNGELIRFGVKQNSNDSDCLIQKEITTANAEGKYVVTLAPNDTNNLRAGTYYYDVGLQSGSDYYNIVPKDIFYIEDSITKAVTD